MATYRASESADALRLQQALLRQLAIEFDVSTSNPPSTIPFAKFVGTLKRVLDGRTMYSDETLRKIFDELVVASDAQPEGVMSVGRLFLVLLKCTMLTCSTSLDIFFRRVDPEKKGLDASHHGGPAYIGDTFGDSGAMGGKYTATSSA